MSIPEAIQRSNEAAIREPKARSHLTPVPYDALSARIAAMLRALDTEMERIRSDALAEADRIVAEARDQAADIALEAQIDAADVRAGVAELRLRRHATMSELRSLRRKVIAIADDLRSGVVTLEDARRAEEDAAADLPPPPDSIEAWEPVQQPLWVETRDPSGAA